MIILFGVKANEAHKMQGVCVIGISRKRLLAAKLRVERSARLQVAKPGLTQRGRSGRAGTVRNCPGFLGGCPAFPAVHRHISDEQHR